MSVSENEIVCYNVGKAITNAKVRGPGFEESEGAQAPRSPGFDAYDCGLMLL